MERLRELRLQRGMTQTQVGDLIGVSCVTVGRYEAGEREPSNAKISAFADYFGVSIDYLMGRDETEKELSAMLGGNWILSLINGEYIPVQYHDTEPELTTDDYDDWLSNTL